MKPYGIIYANSEPVEVEIRFSLSYSDWCLMKNKKFYRKLERFLESRKEQRTENTNDIAEAVTKKIAETMKRGSIY